MHLFALAQSSANRGAMGVDEVHPFAEFATMADVVEHLSGPGLLVIDDEAAAISY